MFSNFDLTAVGAAGLDRLNATISHLQDELSQEHAKTVGDSNGAAAADQRKEPQAPGAEPEATGTPKPAAEAKPEGEKKKKVVKKVVKKKKAAENGDGEAGDAAAADAKPKKKLVKKVVKKPKAKPQESEPAPAAAEPAPAPAAAEPPVQPEAVPPMDEEVPEGIPEPDVGKAAPDVGEATQAVGGSAGEAVGGDGWGDDDDDDGGGWAPFPGAEAPAEPEAATAEGETEAAADAAQSGEPEPENGHADVLTTGPVDDDGWGGFGDEADADGADGWGDFDPMEDKPAEAATAHSPVGTDKAAAPAEAAALPAEEAPAREEEEQEEQARGEPEAVDRGSSPEAEPLPEAGFAGAEEASGLPDQEVAEAAPADTVEGGLQAEESEKAEGDETQVEEPRMEEVGQPDAGVEGMEEPEKVEEDVKCITEEPGLPKAEEPEEAEAELEAFDVKGDLEGGIGQARVQEDAAERDEEEEDDDDDDDGQFAWADGTEDVGDGVGEEGNDDARERRKREAEQRHAEKEREHVAELLAQISAAKQENAAEAAVRPAASEGALNEDMAEKTREELLEMLSGLRGALEAREGQLQRKGEEVVMMQEVQERLMARNEELAKKAHKVSQEDIDELQAEFEQRLGVAERKVYALTKQRDALKRGAEKVSNMEEIVQKKDALIREAKAETEAANRRHADAQGVVKQLQKQIQKLEVEREKAASKLAMEQQKTENIQQHKMRLEGDLSSAYQRAAADMEQQRQHYEGLLQRARESQMSAEERAHNAAKEGAAKKEKEAGAQAAALAETVAELRDALDRQRKAAELREEMLHQDIKDMEKRCMDAERRHEELSSKIPETTRPLLRQIESLQQAAAAQAESWQTAERSLGDRLEEAEAKAASASERERLGADRLSSAQSRIKAMEAAVETLRKEVAEAHASSEADRALAAKAELRATEAEEAEERTAEAMRTLRAERDEFEQGMREELMQERSLREQAERDAEKVQRSCEDRLKGAGAFEMPPMDGSDGPEEEDGPSLAGPPPAMAAPGYKWVLVKEGQDPNAAASSQALQQPQRAASVPLPIDDSPPKLLASAAASQDAVTSQEVERLRVALRSRDGEMESLQDQISKLEATRDSLADELVQALQLRESKSDLEDDLDTLRRQHSQLQVKLASAIELLGEREERVEELEQDMQDVKQLYRDQIEYMCEQVVALTPKAADGEVPSERTPFAPSSQSEDLPVSTTIGPGSDSGIPTQPLLLNTDDVPGGSTR